VLLSTEAGAQPIGTIFSFRAAVLESDVPLEEPARATLEVDLGRLLLRCSPFEDPSGVRSRRGSVQAPKWDVEMDLANGAVTEASVIPTRGRGRSELGMLPPWRDCVTKALTGAQLRSVATKLRVTLVPLDPRALPPPVESRPRPPMIAEQVVITLREMAGSLTPSQVDEVLGRQRPVLAHVFEASAAIEIAYVFEIEPGGRVASARVEGSSGAVAARGLQVIRRWKFPAREAGSNIRLVVQVSSLDAGTR
jgi:hypothetical protein